MSAGNPGNRRGGGGGGMIRLAPSPRDVPSIGAAALSPRSAGGGNALSPTAARRRMNAAAAREAGTGRGGAFWSEGHPEFYAAEVPAASDPPGRKEASTSFRLPSSREARSQAAVPDRHAPQADDASSVVSSSALNTSACSTPRIVVSIESASQGGGSVGGRSASGAGTAGRQARQPSNSRGSQRLATVADRSGSGSGSTSTPRDGGNDGDDVAGSADSTPAQSPNAKAKSKRMVVVDPRSGKKYQLRADDSSPPCLTDKELHVYHKQGRRGGGGGGSSAGGGDGNAAGSGDASSDADAGRGAAASNGRHRRAPSLQSDTYCTAESTECASGSFQTLETASALTDVSYYGRGRGMCAFPGTCHGIDQLSLVDARRSGDAYDDDEERDGAEVASGGRGRGLRVDTSSAGGDSSEEDSGRGSPLGAILGALLSPLGAAARQLLEPTGASHVIMPTPGNVEVTEIKFRRLCLVVFPEEFRGSLSGGDALLGMTFRQDPEDFQAHVATVRRGSRADRLGVKRGDVVSFAVALSNMTEEGNSFLAEKLLKRLESVGMRTSYRELYDILQSRTTNARPVGLVFRRWKKRPDELPPYPPVGRSVNGTWAVPPRSPSRSSPSRGYGITDEFDWSTRYLQGLSIKCRECEFERRAPMRTVGSGEDGGPAGRRRTFLTEGEESADVLPFMPRPNVDPAGESGLVNDALRLIESVVGCIDSTCADGRADGASATHTSGSEARRTADEFLSNRVLGSLVEQAVGLVFVRRVWIPGDDGGAGGDVLTGTAFAVVRKDDGSWSAPCFLSVLVSEDDFSRGEGEDLAMNPPPPSVEGDIKVVVVRNRDVVSSLIEGLPVDFVVKANERANALVRDAAVIELSGGRFRLLDSEFVLAVRVNDSQNQGAYYLSTDVVEASDILAGTVSPPEQSVDFYGALQSLELPYSMHSHPVIPDLLQSSTTSDWVEVLPPQGGSVNGETGSVHEGLRTRLRSILHGDSTEDRREIDIFARKFKYFLVDGVPVCLVTTTITTSDSCVAGTMEEKVLRITIPDQSSMASSVLEIVRKRRPGVSNVGMMGDFSTQFGSITRLSRTPPAGLNLDDDEARRFFSVETDLTSGPIMMLAKSKKDAMLLLCGLKLLLEREKIFDSC